MNPGVIGGLRADHKNAAGLERAAANDRPLVGVFCNFVPDEVIWALGARLVRFDSGSHADAERAEATLPRDACPVVRASMGALPRLSAESVMPDLVVVPTPCDAKRKLGSAFDAHVPVHYMSLPADKTAERAVERWMQEIAGLAKAVSGLTGRRLERRAFRQACEQLNARQSAFRELLRLQRATPPLLRGSEVLAIAAASFTDEPQRCTDQILDLARERSRCRQDAQVGPRVILTGAPVIPPNDRLVRILEAAGIHIVADDLCSGTERLYHPTVPREWSVPEMLLAAAERTLLPCTCPCFVSSRDRVDRILALLEETGANGVVHHMLRACVLFQFDAAAIREAVRARGMPVLELYTDYTDQDSEQLRTRIEAFAEMLRSREP